MTPENLIPGLLLKSRTDSKGIRAIEDFRPAKGRPFRQWLVNGLWLNYAEVDARYTILKPKPARTKQTV